MRERTGNFRQYVSFRLEHVSKVARDAADTIYRRECGLDIRQLRVLRVLETEPDLTVSEIVEETMFERTLVSRIIHGMVKQKLVARRICDDDARQIRLSLTPAGFDRVIVAGKLGDDLNEDLLSVLTKEQRKSLNLCLDKLMTWQPPKRQDTDETAEISIRRPSGGVGLAVSAMSDGERP